MPVTRTGQRATLLMGAIGTFMAALDSSIVNVSIPAIMQSYGRGMHEVEWVVSAYMISFAALMPLTAWLRDRIGNVRLYAGSLGIFTLASALCGLAPNLETLIAARVLQALGGGAITPTAMAMIADAFPINERGKALGWWGFVAVLGPAIGPTIGGVLTESWGWRWIFLVNVPVGIPLLIAALRYLPGAVQGQITKHRFLWLSFLSLLVCIVALLYATSRLPRAGIVATDVQIAIATAALSGWLFFADWRRQGDAIIELSLLRIANFRRCIIITIVRSMALLGTTFLIPIFLQGPRALTETMTGIVMAPGAIALALTMPLSGRLISSSGTRLLVGIGVALLGVYCFLCADWQPVTGQGALIMGLIMRGVGIGFLVTPISTLAINAAPQGRAGMASSMMNLVQQMAGALGIALFSGMFDFFLHESRTTEAQVAAFRATFIGAGILVLSVLPLSLRLPTRQQQKNTSADGIDTSEAIVHME